MFNNVFVHTWMALPREIRGHLVDVFKIERTGISEIRDNEVISDGYSNIDLQAITLEKMNEYIGSTETSFPHAWEVTCSKAKGELYPPIGLDQVVQMADEPKEVPEEINEPKKQTNETKKNK